MSIQNNEMLNGSTTSRYMLTEEQMTEQRRRAREHFERYQRTLIRDYIISLENSIAHAERQFSKQKNHFDNAKVYSKELQKYFYLLKDYINNIKKHFDNLEEYITHIEDPEIVIIPSLKERIENVKNKIKTLTEHQETFILDISTDDWHKKLPVL